MEMSNQEVQEILPHRYPFLMVDRILELTLGEKVIGLKNVTINESFFQGHFPGRPVMPGVLILEAMAQTGGILAYKSTPEMRGKLIYFLAIDKVKFRKPVIPGDQLILELSALRRGNKVWKMQGKAFVGESLVAEAELTAAIADDKAIQTGEEA
ncbi:MAG: 3-hydroxyacyl-[acyl-carrier-protein] dehydratase FabZ [Desulfobacca sp.]|nr:3-hydroxyacyl-[acyl-carrier-protein] dehydratase FabZ [Desulfobacca sp.]